MPTLTLEGYNGGFTWQITDLSNPFNSTYYKAAGITKYKFTKESTSISGVVSSIDANDSRTKISTPEVDVEYKAGTYTFWAWCQAANGTYYPVNDEYGMTVVVTDSSASRPDDWEWWNTIKKGKPIALEADEWNAFCDRINEFREYQGLYAFGYTEVESGDPISADIVNEAIDMISWLSITEDLPDKVESGDPITAVFFQDLVNALNSIE